MNKEQRDKRTAKIMEDFEHNALGLNDTFQFQCRTCGKCCMNREDILLTARDLHNIARELGKTVEYVLKRYCETYIGDTSRLPIVRLRPLGPERICPLMYEKRCIVHKAKPVVCALYPLGRGFKSPVTEAGIERPIKYEPIYFIQSETCGISKHTHTVRSWLEYFGIQVEDEFYSIWNELISELSEFIRNLEAAKAPDKLIELLWNAVFYSIYVNYDTEKELVPQFHRNSECVKELMLNIAAKAS